MKKYFIVLSSFIFPFAVMAHGAQEEGKTLMDQFKEFLPFEHLKEGHWFAVIFSIILWISFIIALYPLVAKIRKKQL